MPIATGKESKDTWLQNRRSNKSQRHAPSKTSCFFGLETKPEVIWEDWDLDKEFTKSLVLKNIETKLQRLQVRHPKSKVFSASVPEHIALSPGISFSFPVTFKTLERRAFEDNIEFQSKGGSFQVCLRAVLPSRALELPDSVTLPLCAVQHSTQTSFQLKNVSKLQTFFKWNCSATFQLNPEQGVLKPTQECQITVVFRPEEARLYEHHANCTFGDGELPDNCSAVLLQGQAKYPYLQFRNVSRNIEDDKDYPELSFGSVAVGQSFQKHFDIFNPSPVKVSFSLSRLPGAVGSEFEPEFSCDITAGNVMPGKSIRVSVIYRPAIVDRISVEYLTLKYNGGLSDSQLKLTGKCLGTHVFLSSSLIDFGCVEQGGSTERTFVLLNDSPVVASYLWDLDGRNSVFKILPACGTVLPHCQVKIKVFYRPTHPLAHYRKVPCLIFHRKPLFLDLIGTCQMEIQQHAVLKPEHLSLYKDYWLNIVVSQGCGPQLDQEKSSPTNKEIIQKGNVVLMTTEMEVWFQTSIGSTSSLPVSVTPSELLFNHEKTTGSAPSGLSESVTLTNNTKSVISLQWTFIQESPFSVCPSSFNLKPQQSTSFQVTCDPKQLQMLHGGQLECFLYLKDNQDAPHEALCPPWCVTVRAISHCFHQDKELFTASCSLQPPQVVFPALTGTSYQTVLLQNDGDRSLTFSLNPRPNVPSTDSIQIQPGCGFIQSGDHQIITIQATPLEDNLKKHFDFLLHFNKAEFTKDLTVVCVPEKPCVSLESGSTLYFPPTGVNFQTQHTHHIRNLSLLPLQFEWSIPEADQDLIAVRPDTGELHPNEISVQTWFFSPIAEKKYTFKPILSFWPIQSDASNKLQLSLDVVGTGSVGHIEAEKALLDVGEVLVGNCQSVDIPLMNKSPCPVSFSLSVQQTLPDPDSGSHSSNDKKGLCLDSERREVPPYSQLLIPSKLRLSKEAQYIWVIRYQLVNARGAALCPPKKLCEVRAKGAFPTLQVIDACSGGSVSRLSKLHLWRLFSLDRLNEHLLSTLIPEEHSLKNHTQDGGHAKPKCTKFMLDFNFASAPLHSDPSHFMLMLYNPASIPVDWAFLFPKDKQVKLEDWAVTGEFTSTELYQMKVQNNQLFNVSPRTGSLQPGQKRAVCFTHSHECVGEDQLHIVFRLSLKKEILLNFKGVTVENSKPVLHLGCNRHIFTSVTIGDCNPPHQMCEIYNGGGTPARYEVDTAVLSQLQGENFNHPVLCSLNPKGEVLPGRTAMLEWIFSPLEAKVYQINIPIYIRNSETIVVHFMGYGTSAMSLPTCGRSRDSKTPEHSVKKVPFPGQIAFLSENSICLGDIPVCSQFSRIFFLTNLSETDSVCFMWEIPQQNLQQAVEIYPEKGGLCAGECVLCVLTFTSFDYPTVYELDLVCQVTKEVELVQYNNALQCWEEEKERQQNEFPITDKNVTASRIVLTDEKSSSLLTRKGPPLRRNKVLPPIGCRNSSKVVGSLCSRQARPKHMNVWCPPKPPQPALLHLRVTAHSHEFQDYAAHFPQEYKKHNRYLQLKNLRGKISGLPSSPAGTFLSESKFGRTMLKHVLNDLLRNTFADSGFVESLITVACEPIIYRPVASSASAPCYPTSSLAAGQPHEQVQRGVDKGEAAVNLETSPQAQALCAPTEVILMNTLQNIMMEAIRGEFVLTKYPRSILKSRQTPRADKDRETSKT